MPPDKICKTVHQYSKRPVAPEDMQKFQEIADDYCFVKNYVYQRYGGINSLVKIYPGYTVQNEMTKSELRARLGLPSVYFYLAVFDALGDIKAQWTRAKTALGEQIKANDSFQDSEKHYLRFVLKADACLIGILTGQEIALPKQLQETYEALRTNVEADRLNSYLRRQVRKNFKKLTTDKADGFAVAERAYRYGSLGKEHGIFLSTKENRKRVFVPLKDENEYKKQLYVKLMPESSSIEIAAPQEVRTRVHKEYVNEIGLSPGIEQMFTTDSGHVYGEAFGRLHQELVDFIGRGSRTYHREKENNPGREKYNRQKKRLEAGLHSYVNQQINRMLETEKPGVIYIPKLPKGTAAGVNKKINYSVSLWHRGYIRKRLAQKCRENRVRLEEVWGKDISRECSNCGALGNYVKDVFQCPACGHTAGKKENAAKNALIRGKTERYNEDFHAGEFPVQRESTENNKREDRVEKCVNLGS